MTLSVKKLQPAHINNMSYNEFIGLVRETNRPPGGYASISRIAEKTFLRKGQSLLEIGTSTGIAAIEFARLTRARIVGIDINPTSLREARQRAQCYGVSQWIHFELANAMALPYRDSSFDIVFCGNVTSLVASRDKALAEYSRVLKIGGYLASIPMYYLRPPSKNLLRRVSDAIQVPIQPLYKDYWIRFFARPPFESYFIEDYAFDRISPEVVKEFVRNILHRDHLKDLRPTTKATLNHRYAQYMQLFRENLAHMGYSIMLLRKESNPMDAELFTSRKL